MQGCTLLFFFKIAHIFLGDSYLGMEKYFLQKVFTFFFKLKKRKAKQLQLKLTHLLKGDNCWFFERVMCEKHVIFIWYAIHNWHNFFFFVVVSYQYFFGKKNHVCVVPLYVSCLVPICACVVSSKMTAQSSPPQSFHRAGSQHAVSCRAKAKTWRACAILLLARPIQHLYHQVLPQYFYPNTFIKHTFCGVHTYSIELYNIMH